MAITKSAQKEIRSSAKRRAFNLKRSRKMKDVTKTIDKEIREGKVEDIRKRLPEIQKAIDKAAKRGIIKKNTASRKKSRIVAKLKRK